MKIGHLARSGLALPLVLTILAWPPASHAGDGAGSGIKQALQQIRAGAAAPAARPASGESRDVLRPIPPVHAAPAEARAAALHRAFPHGLVTWENGNPHRILLPGESPLAADKSLSGMKSASLDLVAEHQVLFGVAAGDLRLETERTADNLVYLIYGQLHDGIPVEGRRVDFRWTRDGRLVMAGSDVAKIAGLSPSPRLTPDDALGRAAGNVGLDPSGAVREGLDLVVVPDGHFGQSGDRLSYRVLLRAPPGEVGVWMVWVDARSGDVLNTRDLIMHSSFQGRIDAWAEPLTAGDNQELYPAPYARIRLELPSGEPLGETVADEGGFFSFGNVDAEEAVYLTFLEGRYCKVGTGFEWNVQAFETPAQGDAEHVIIWDEQNSVVVQRDAYVHVNIAHATTKRWDPGWTDWDHPMPTVVEVTAGTCNAYFDLQRIVFYAQGNGCASTGRLADVVYHEYAHAITYGMYLPGLATSAMHEAYSDYYGTTLTNQSKVGVGFRGPGTHLRDVKNTRQWPRDISADGHITGLILAGAFWDLREDVGPEVADHLYHFHRYGRPMSFDDALTEVLLVDDNDGNVFNGTPHMDAILSAFLAHGIGDPSVQIHHEQLPDTENSNVDLVVDVNVLSLFDIDPDSVFVHYRTEPDAQFTEVPLEEHPDGGTRSFRAILPGQARETLVEYFLFAADVEGHRARLPSGAPDTLFAFFVGEDHQPPIVAVTPLNPATADQSSYRISATVTDNTRLIDRVEVQAEGPFHEEQITEPLVLVSGGVYSGAFSVGIATVGDRISYRILATDRAAEPNTTVWPGAGEWAVFEVRDGWSADLEGDDGDMTASGDWEWGDLHESKGEALSGSRVWATRLEGRYSNLLRSTLNVPLDLTGWDRATLQFWHRYSTEPGNDGARLGVSRDNGDWFRTAIPRKGYSHGNVSVFQGEGFSGGSDGWELVEVPLDAHLGREILFRFEFATNQNVNEDGWILDDIQLTRRQTLSEPLALSAESGLPGWIPLAWREPRGVVVDSARERFIGYNVYRGTSPGTYGDQPINDEPVTGITYADLGTESEVPYYYVVKALYVDGESPPSNESSATSFAALVSLSIDSLGVHLERDAALDTVLVVSNGGTGALDFETFLADQGEELSDVQLVYRRRDGSLDDPIMLHDDGRDAGASPDISAILAGDDGDNLVLTMREHSPHGNPAEDFTVVFGLDIDLDQDTGIGSQNFGADYLVIMGQVPLDATGGQIPAFIVEATELDRIEAIPEVVMLDEGADSVSVVFPLSIVGRPVRMAIRAVSFDAGLRLIDSQPDTLESAWLTRIPTKGSTSPGEEAEIELSLDATGLLDGIYRGKLLMKTNDFARPLVEIGVALTVGEGIGSLAVLDFEQRMEGLEIFWRPPRGSAVTSFRLFRSDETGAEVKLGGEDDLLPLEDGGYRFLDRGVMSGGLYTYRFEGVTEEGSPIGFGTAEHTFSPAAPLQLEVLNPRPSPFRSTVALRFGLPREGKLVLGIYDVQGRLVRSLENRRVDPGVYDVVWDGRDGAGNRAASGVYFALLQWERIKRVKRMVLTR